MSYSANIVTFVTFRHFVTILDTSFTTPKNLTHDLDILEVLIILLFLFALWLKFRFSNGFFDSPLFFASPMLFAVPGTEVYLKSACQVYYLPLDLFSLKLMFA